nr:hypothetical protein [Paracoccaceae bacterium]
MQVKWGRIDRVRLLLDLGASPNTVAHIARYGGARLSIPVQAVNTMMRPGETEDERSARITELLGLLKSHGLTVSPEDRPKIVEAAERRQQDGLRTW